MLRTTLVMTALLGSALVSAVDAAPQQRPFRPGSRPPGIIRPDLNRPKPPDDQNQWQQRRFFMMMIARQQALTRMALQQAALAAASQPAFVSVPYPMPVEPYTPRRQPQLANQAAAAPAVVKQGLLAGVMDEQGNLAWPLGLQILPPADKTKERRQRVENLMQQAAQQTAQGRLQATLVQDATAAIDELRTALGKRRLDMPQRTFEDASNFLRDLEALLK